MTDNKNDKIETAATSIGQKLVLWLKGKGWSETLAKLATGAVLGAALGIAAAFGLTSCTASYTQTAAGDVAFSGSIVQPVEYQK